MRGCVWARAAVGPRQDSWQVLVPGTGRVWPGSAQAGAPPGPGTHQRCVPLCREGRPRALGPAGPGTRPSGPPSPSPQLAPDGIGFTRCLLLGERPGQGGDQPPRPQTLPQSRPPPGTHRGTAAAREGRRGGRCGPRGAALPGVLAATPALVCGEALGLCTTFALCRSTKAMTQRGPPGPGSPPSPGLPWVCMRPRLRSPQTGRVTALVPVRDAPSGCSQQERAGQALGARTPDRSLWADPGAHSGGQTPSLRATRAAQPRLAPCREAEPVSSPSFLERHEGDTPTRPLQGPWRSKADLQIKECLPQQAAVQRCGGLGPGKGCCVPHVCTHPREGAGLPGNAP